MTWIARLALPLLAPLVRGLLGRIFKAEGEGGLGATLARLLGLGPDQGISIPERARTHLQRGLAAWQDQAAKTPEIGDDLAQVAARGLLGLLTRED